MASPLAYRTAILTLGSIILCASGCVLDWSKHAQQGSVDSGTTVAEDCSGDTWDHDHNRTTPCKARRQCSAGQFVTSDGDATTDRTCAGCATGTFSTQMNVTSCKTWRSCEPGSYVSNTPSATSDRACTVCKQGSFSEKSNQSKCLPAPSCPAGTALQESGTSSSDPVCKACNPGEYCAGGTVAPVACDGNSWDHDHDAATACAARTNCVAGQYTTAIGDATTDRTCAGCASGTFSAEENATSCATWTSCDPGSYVSNMPSTAANRLCMTCQPGTFTNKANEATCLPAGSCQAGTVQVVAGTSTSDPVCQACSAGQYCSGGTAAAVPCKGSTWDNDQDPSTDCVGRTVCIAGQYVISNGDATTDRTCAACASGTFSTLTDAASCTSWATCAAGTYVSNTPSATTDRLCTACAQGTFTDKANQSTCLPLNSCPAGTVQTTAGTSTSPPTCVACSAGQYCAGGTAPAVACSGSTWDNDKSPATACVARTNCVAGQFVTADGNATTDRTCAACASGTFSTQQNSTSCKAWTQCVVPKTAGSSTTDQVCAELWAKQFGTSGDDNAQSVTLDGGGNAFIAGGTSGAFPGQTNSGSSTSDAFIRKYDSSGTEVWTWQFGTSAGDAISSISVDASENLYVIGDTAGTLPSQTSAGGFDIFVRKYNSTGAEVWTRQFGSTANDFPSSIAVDGSGNVYAWGYTLGTLPGQTSAGSTDVFVRKYSSAGTELWTRQFGSSGDDFSGADESLAIDSSGSVYVAGYTWAALPGKTSGGNTDAFVRKYDGSGTELWTLQFGTSTGDYAESLAVDGAGNLMLGGGTYGSLPGQTNSGSGTEDVFVRKYDSSGTELWTRQFGSSANDFGLAVRVDANGDACLSGYTRGALPGQTNAGGTDVFARKYSAAGTELWTRQFGTNGNDYGYSQGIDTDGNVYLAGYTSAALVGLTSAGGNDAFLVKLAP